MYKHLLSLLDLSQEHFQEIISRSVEIGKQQGTSGNFPLAGKTVGIYFKKTSTRTRTSFQLGASRLGATTISYGPTDLQINTGETIEDTTRVLGGYLDALVVRTAGPPEEVRSMADLDCLHVVNAMTEDEHPSQAISDLAMIQRYFGELSNCHILYLGEGNNTAAALALAVSRVQGAKASFFTPRGYGLPSKVMEQAIKLSKKFGGQIEESHSTENLPNNVDVVYTTRWQTTGTSKQDPLWREKFFPFRVTDALMEKVSIPKRTVFMHDLPAVRGEDCEGSVLDGQQSIAFLQAQQKLYTAMAILEWCLS